MSITKSIFLILGIVAATSLLTAGGFTTPASADENGDYYKVYCYVYDEESDEHDDYEYHFEVDGYHYYCYEYNHDDKHDNKYDDKHDN